MQIKIPANSSATITLPKERAGGDAFVNGKPLAKAPGVTLIIDPNASPEYRFASGTYSIDMPYTEKASAVAPR